MHTKYFACLIFVGKGRRRKYFNGENFPIYGINTCFVWVDVLLYKLQILGRERGKSVCVCVYDRERGERERKRDDRERREREERERKRERERVRERKFVCVCVTE